MINSNAKDLGDALVRPGLRALVPYESARRIGGSGEVWLNANENPYARSLTISAERWHRYPDFQPPAKPDPKHSVPISRRNFVELCHQLTTVDEQVFVPLHDEKVGLVVALREGASHAEKEEVE